MAANEDTAETRNLRERIIAFAQELTELRHREEEIYAERRRAALALNDEAFRAWFNADVANRRWVASPPPLRPQTPEANVS